MGRLAEKRQIPAVVPQSAENVPLNGPRAARILGSGCSSCSNQSGTPRLGVNLGYREVIVRVERRKQRTANIGIFGVGHYNYWPQFPGLLEELHQKMDVLVKKVEPATSR